MRKPLLLSLCLLSACYVTPDATPPASFTAAEVIPPRPVDTAAPLAAVIWALNYDLRQFDTVWAWLHTGVPEGVERSRAIGAAALIAVAELDRLGDLDEGVTAFDAAIPAFPDDARLPCWRAYLVFLKARNANDAAATASALDGLRAASKAYPSFTMFGVTLAAGGWEGATPELLEEARKGFDAVIDDTNRMQSSTEPGDAVHMRRIFDTPIAPYNVIAMQAMISDLALRAGKKDEARRGYFTAINANNANRWPWRAEVERRLGNLDAVMAGLAARPATETALGSQEVGALGVSQAKTDPRFGGRVGNGSCTVCHTHVTTFDLNETAPEVGWIKVVAAPVKGAPNLAPAAFALPDGANVIPAGFAIATTVDAAATRDFYAHDELFDGTMYIPAKPGTYFVAIQASIDGQQYQGYSSREFGKQRFVEVRAGKVSDLSGAPISLAILPPPPAQ